MSSQGGDSAEQQQQHLLRLIYLHLKENGYRKAASVLKKHISQKETDASASLYEIYAGWLKSSDDFGDTKQEPGLDRESPPKKSHLSDYAEEGDDEVKPEKGDIVEKTEEPEFKPIIHDGSVSLCNEPFISSVVTKSSESAEGHLECKDEPDADQLQTSLGYVDSVPPLVEFSKPTITQEEETVPLPQDIGIKVRSSDSENAKDSEEEQRPQQQTEADKPKSTASISVAETNKGKSSVDRNDSEREEEANVQIPANRATAAPLKSSQDTTSQAVVTPKISAAQTNPECSGSKSNDDSVSDQEVMQDQKAVSHSPNKTTTEMTPAPVKPSLTLGLTAALLKKEERSDNDESESEETFPPTQTTSTKPTVNTRSSTSPVASSCQSLDSEDSESEDMPVQKAIKTPKVTPAVPAKPRQSVHRKAKDALEVPPAESSESESSDDLESEEEPVKENTKPVLDTAHKATTVIVTPGPTKVSTKTEETSESDEQSECGKIRPTQKEVKTSTLTTTQTIPKNRASAVPPNPSQHKPAQAKTSSKGLGVENSESPKSSNDSASEEKADGKPNAAKKTTGVMTSGQVKPSFTSDRTTALSKSGESSESDYESESEDEIPPTQKAKILKGTPAQISSTGASKTPVKPSYPRPLQAKTAKKADSPESSGDSDSEEKAGVTPKAKPVSDAAETTVLKGPAPGKPSYTSGLAAESSKPEESSESDDESESEEEIPPTQVMSTKPTANTHSATPAMVNRGQSSDGDREDSESKEDAPDQKPELTIKPKAIPTKTLSAEVPVKAKTASTTFFKATTKTSASVRQKKRASTDSEDEIPRKSAPAKQASLGPVKPGHPTPSKAKAAPKAPSAKGKVKEASSDDSESDEDPSVKLTVVMTQKRPEEKTLDQAAHTPEVILKPPVPTEEEVPAVSDKIAVATSNALPNVKCKSTTQTVRKIRKTLKKVTSGSEDMSNEDTSLSYLALKTSKAKLRAVAPELSSDIKSSTTKGTLDDASVLVQEVSATVDSEPDILGTESSDAAPKSPKDSDVIEEEISQTFLNPNESMEKATEKRRRRKKKKKKKKKASVQFQDENVLHTGPGQVQVLPNGGSAISLDQLITEPCKASEEPATEMERSKNSVGLKKSLVSGVNNEEESEVETTTEAMPRAKKKRRSTDKEETEPKSKKKKKKKTTDTEANPAESGNNPHSERRLSLEESEKKALTPSDDTTAKMGSDDSMESNSTTLILSAKALKKIKKKMKEKVNVKNTGRKKIKATLKMNKAHKTMSVFTSVAEQLLGTTTKKDLKKSTVVKRPLLAFDPKERKKSDKDSIIRSEPESEVPPFKKKKKNKSNRKEKTPSGKKQTQDTEDHELQNQGVEQGMPVKKKKKKKKNRWKDRGKEIKTPFKVPQELHLDTPPPLGISPEPSKAALGKVKKKKHSFKNSE